MAFRLDKLTVKSQEAVQRAQSLASEKGHPELDPLHLLAALLDEQEGVARPTPELAPLEPIPLADSGDDLTSDCLDTAMKPQSVRVVSLFRGRLSWHAFDG